MTDKPDNTTNAASDFDVILNGPTCQVAYTLNNAQPVACTIIGDQPMFYMDFEEDHEDDQFLGEQEINLLEKEITRLKRELDEMDRFASFLQDEGTKVEDFYANSASMFEPAPAAADSTNDFARAALKQKIIDTLAQSRTGKAYLDCGAQYRLEILLSPQVEFAAYDRKSCQILINPHLPFADMVLLAARELRRHWQHRNGALINPLMFQPDSAILINRLQQADLTTSIIRMAWELQLSGQKDIWERLENSAMADLARAFAHEAFLDFRTINNGVANAAVLEAWFLSERCKAEDRILIQQMLTDTKGYVFENGEAAKSVQADLIGALGTMPFGKNYLAQHAAIIMNDTIFTDVRDRSNANFLWFIKFERSFRETEQGLQKGESSNGQSGHSTNTNAGTSNAQSGSATIVQFKPEQDNSGQNSAQGVLPAKGQKRAKNASSKAKAADAGKIIYLRRWSGE